MLKDTNMIGASWTDTFLTEGRTHQQPLTRAKMNSIPME